MISSEVIIFPSDPLGERPRPSTTSTEVPAVVEAMLSDVRNSLTVPAITYSEVVICVFM